MDLCILKRSFNSLCEQDYPPKVNDHSVSVDNFVPDMLNNNLGNGLDLLEVSEHVKAQVADVVLEYVSVEGDFDQLNVHLWSIILWKKNMQQLSIYNISMTNVSHLI